MPALFKQGLSSKNGFVRKGAAFALRLPKWWNRLRARPGDYRAAPPLLANSIPKSGTHLLYQIVDGLPRGADYGAFLGSMISSFQFRERSPANVSRFIERIAPGEIVRAHLYYDALHAADLRRRNVVHYFVYRDPRDVVLSEAHYLREMNRWHRLHPYFAKCASIDEAITLSISGLNPPVPSIEFPDVAQRYARYLDWLEADDCLAIRFEDLVSDQRANIIRQMAALYAAHCENGIDVDACAERMAASIAPKKSHTFRSGKKAGWQREFTAEHRRLFDQLAGDLLIRLGYETNHDWATSPPAATPG